MQDKLKQLNDIFCQALSLEITNISIEQEARNYCGANFKVGMFSVKFRRAKITPKKTGQFVTLWKRSITGATIPFSIEDTFDFYIIETEHGTNSGCFVFPGSVLAQRKILSIKEHGGKRGFRVYAKWDLPENKQAKQA